MINLDFLKPYNFVVIGLMGLVFALLIDKVHDSIVFSKQGGGDNA